MSTHRTLAVAATSIVTTLIASGNPVAADPVEPSSSPMFVSAAPTNEKHSAAKEEDEAFGLSFGGSVVGLTVALAVGEGQPTDNYSSSAREQAMTDAGLSSLVLLPSAGHWYAGEADIGPLLVRSVGAAAFMYGVTGPSKDCTGQDWCFNLPTDRQVEGVLIGSTLLLAGTIYDLATAHRAVRNYNREHHLDVQIAPMVSRATTGNTTGVMVGGSF